MENKNIDLGDLVADATYLECAIDGLNSFVYHNFVAEDMKDIKVESISALSGLLVSIQLLVKKHVKELAEYEVNL
ncbi:hypothetical protein ACFFIF_08065 [Vagococcus entomophilus]|uniref:Uncharacterized protein n=1 Tax=Vagococcus entomophilus TaxID=1160095 RepID=A0A430AHD5_9ENTE|nr:hypothetical protein [Vagococcus entomophilus]RSU07283.1 hypothetical protein CBF30_08505 [Vagococcus entomophilus]